MLLIPCPVCGLRPELEFRYGGQAHVARPLASSDDEAVARSLYLRDNVKGVQTERWRHISGCGRFFNCVRDTVTDKILLTYASGAPAPGLSAPAAGAAT